MRPTTWPAGSTPVTTSPRSCVWLVTQAISAPGPATIGAVGDVVTVVGVTRDRCREKTIAPTIRPIPSTATACPMTIIGRRYEQGRSRDLIPGSRCRGAGWLGVDLQDTEPAVPPRRCAFVCDDAQEPGPHLPALSKLVELSPRVHCRLLNRIFRKLPVLEHADGQPVGRFEQGPQQRRERRRVTMPRGPNQIRFGGVLHAVVLYTPAGPGFVTAAVRKLVNREASARESDMKPFRFAAGIRNA